MARFGEVSGRIDQSGANGINSTTPLVLAGSSSAPITFTSANTKTLQYYFNNKATSGDNRGMYLRLYLSGAGSGGEAARIFTTINDVACGTAHGAHISLNFADSGELSGLGVAGRNTLHIPDDAGWTGGNLSPLMAEIYSDGAASDPDGVTNLSYIQIVNGGDSSGIADVDDDINLLSIQGHTIASGNMIVADTDETKFSHKARIIIGSTAYYIMLTSS